MPSVKIRRRRFVGFVVGAAAGAGAGVPVGRIVSDVLATAETDIYPPRGPESHSLSVCTMCPGGCGLRVRRIGERLVKLEGNPLHPVNAGRLCPKGQAALQGLYHPDRIRGPLRRKGPRGSLSSFEPVAWDEALDQIASRLGLLRDGKRPESLVVLRRGGRDIGMRVCQRFLQAFGTPNDVVLDRGDESAAIALELAQGVHATPAYDIASTDYVLSLGGALLEGFTSPVHAARAFGRFRQVRAGRRGKLVQVEPRHSMTAAAADEWVEVRPGTEGILGLGVAAVIVSEGLHDKTFLQQHARGFEDERGPDGKVREGLRSLLDRRFSLEEVSARTGVSAHTILRIARELATARPGLVIGSRKGPLLPGALLDHLVAATLNALVGNVDAPGGALVPEPPPIPPWPDPPADPIAEVGRSRDRLDAAGELGGPLLTSDPERLAEALASRKPYAADVLFLMGADPRMTSAAPERFAAALEGVPTVVSFATIPDDSSVFADFILPEAHFLERWDLHDSPPGVAFPLVSLAKPALAAPRHDARPVGQVLLDLASRLGLSGAFPARDIASLVEHDLKGLYGTRRGAVMGGAFDEAWVRMMERAGWWAPGYHSEEELWTRAQESGGWWDPFYDHEDWSRVIRTSSGRIELQPELLDRLAREAPAREVGSAAREHGEDALRLLLFEPLPLIQGTGAELPFLQGILDPSHEEGWETWAEIHPEIAASLGIEDRRWVRITSATGVIVARARVTERMARGAVAIPVGLGKSEGGRWARGLGGNPMRLLGDARDPVSGLPDLSATIVRVSPIEPGANGGAARQGGA